MERGLTFGSRKVVQGNSLIAQRQGFLHRALVLYGLGDFCSFNVSASKVLGSIITFPLLIILPYVFHSI